MGQDSMAGFGDAVWDRTDHRGGTISRQLFNLIMSATLVLGIGATAITAYFSTGWLEIIPATAEHASQTNWVGPVSPWVLYIGVLVCTILGSIIALSSDNPIVSLLGYAMVCIPFGLLLGPTVGMYTPDSVAKVLLVTLGVVVVLGFVGAAIPDSLEGAGIWLLGGLTILLFGTVGVWLMGWLIPGFPLQGALRWMDWIGVVLFSGYVIFDMNRAQHITATPDNAIDCALALYLDVLNLFVRLLAIMGKKK